MAAGAATDVAAVARAAAVAAVAVLLLQLQHKLSRREFAVNIFGF